MNKILLSFIVLVGLQGCTTDMSEVEQFVEAAKAKKGRPIEPIPQYKEFKHYAYNASYVRSPFEAPQQELTLDIVSESRDCLQPDVTRRKTMLEAFGLDNLVMRGSLGQSNNLWALIETGTGEIFRVRKGHYLGLFHGQITNISDQQVDMIEVVPDGAGCWIERNNSIALVADYDEESISQ